MHCSMFGKLPSKRDFVAYNMPRPFLDPWESWLQTSLAASKLTLGNTWQDIFLTMPIWRFWFGPEVFGQAVTGALMPSVDGVGRYFPLCLCACAPQDTLLVPPPSNELDMWHETCEQFLLQMLEDRLEQEPLVLLEKFAFAPTETAGQPPLQSGQSLRWTSLSGEFDGVFQSFKTFNNQITHNSKSYWWTHGGPNHQAQLLVIQGRAEDTFLTSLMTGNFS